MISRIKLIFIFFIITSFNPVNDVREYHISKAGLKEVILFENKYPYIANHKYVYIAYLQQHYSKDADFIMLLRNHLK